MSQDERGFYNSLMSMNVKAKPASDRDFVTAVDYVRALLNEALREYENYDLDHYQNMTVEAYNALNNFVGKTPSELTLQDFAEWMERNSDFPASDFTPANEYCIFNPALRYHILGDNISMEGDSDGGGFYGSWASLEIIRDMVRPMFEGICEVFHIYTYDPIASTFENVAMMDVIDNPARR